MTQVHGVYASHCTPALTTVHDQKEWDSIPGLDTMIETAVPSQSPSRKVSSSTSADIDLEIGLDAEQHVDDTAAGTGQPCVDPATLIVSWDGAGDPENPMNLPYSKKILISVVAAMITFTVSFASSSFSTATQVTAEKFDVSSRVMILGVSLYVLGFACGKTPTSFPLNVYCITIISSQLPLVHFLGASNVKVLRLTRHLTSKCPT